MARTFKEATELLCLTGPELAEIFGVSAQSIRQARLDPEKVGYRTPPAGWEAKLAELAGAKGGELAALAEELRKVRT